MNADDLKDQLREQFSSLWGRIQESSVYNNIKEQFEALPQAAQRAISIGAGVIVALFIVYIPFSYILAANDSIEEFNENRGLIRELLRVARFGDQAPPLPPQLSITDLQNQAQMILTELKLVPEQMGPITPLEDRPAKNLTAAMIQQAGISVSINKINLSQILDIGYRFQNINLGTKITGLEIVAHAEDNHYYNVTYKLVNFSLPQNSNSIPQDSQGEER